MPSPAVEACMQPIVPPWLRRPAAASPAGRRCHAMPSPARRLLQLVLALIAVALTLAASAHAHPIHTSLAEADYNRATKQLEIALRVFADDFEEALSARAKTKISLQKTPRAEFDTLARAYLADRFIVKSPDGVVAPHTLLGRELKDAANELWLFFEVALPTGVDNATIHHAVLAEKFSDQINSVQLRDGDRKTTLVFLPSHREKRIRFRQ